MNRTRHGLSAVHLRRSGLWRVLYSAPILVLAAVLLIPTVCFLAIAFFPSAFGQGGANVTLTAFRDGYQSYVLRALFNSVWVSVTTSVLAVGIAVVLAWLIERKRIAGARAWRVGVWCLLLVPTYLTALGLQYLLAPSGVVDWMTHWNPVFAWKLLFGPIGVVTVLTLRGIPFGYFAVAGVVRSFSWSVEEAARVHGLPTWRRYSIQIGSVTPAILAGCLLVFAESISDFGVASTLAANAHFPIITYVVFLFSSTFPVNFPAASAVSWSLIGTFALALFVQAKILRGRRYDDPMMAGGSAHDELETRTTATSGVQGGTPRWRLFAPIAVGALFVLGLVAPMIGIVISSLLGGSASSGFSAVVARPGLSFSAYHQVFSSPSLLGSVWLSLRLSVVGASIAVLFGLGYNLLIQFRMRRRLASLLDLGLTAIIGLPSIVIGAGFIFFYDLPAIYRALPIYNTLWLLLIGFVVGLTPVASRMLRGGLAQAGRAPFDAARVHGNGAVFSWTRTVLPLISRPMVSSWLFIVAMIMFELPLAEILHPPNGVPVSVVIAVTLKSEVATSTALTVVAIAAMLVLLGAVGFLQAGIGALVRARARRESSADLEPVGGLVVVGSGAAMNN
jgi:iron(III) transport system permease protein